MLSVYTAQSFITLSAINIYFLYRYAVLQEEKHSFAAPSSKTKLLLWKITSHIHFNKEKICGKVQLKYTK
jgi:hypothetical protein